MHLGEGCGYRNASEDAVRSAEEDLGGHEGPEDLGAFVASLLYKISTTRRATEMKQLSTLIFNRQMSSTFPSPSAPSCSMANCYLSSTAFPTWLPTALIFR